MKVLSGKAIQKLDLVGAIEREATTSRNLLPTEPGWDRVNSQRNKVAKFCENSLRAGFHASLEVEVAARKAGHGVRPVPYWGIIERIIYRALTEELLKHQRPLDRTTEAYLRFVRAPVTYASDLQAMESPGDESKDFFFLNSPVKYVVKSDITAFYQFIDHGILAEELLLIGSDFELIEALLDLLQEVQGRRYGLPQLMDPSDALSEIVVDRIERSLLRDGAATWRFNDDFRIACRTYAEALSAIEMLDRSARMNGLVISENKTVTVGFLRYMLETLGLQRSDVGETISPDQVEDVVGDYSDEFGEDDSDAALALLNSASPGGNAQGGIDLRKTTTTDVRILRRALNGLAKAADARGVSKVLELLIFAPALTPSVMRYLARVAEGDEAAVAAVIDSLMNNVSQNEWQQIWLIDLMRQLGLLDPAVGSSADTRVDWVVAVRLATRSAPLRSVATRALASSARIDFTAVIGDTAASPQALLPIYAMACMEALSALPDDERGVAIRQINLPVSSKFGAGWC